MKQTNQGYIMMGLQSGKGAVCTPDIAIPYLDDSFSTDQQAEALKSGGDNEYLLEHAKTEHKENENESRQTDTFLIHFC